MLFGLLFEGVTIAASNDSNIAGSAVTTDSKEQIVHLTSACISYTTNGFSGSLQQRHFHVFILAQQNTLFKSRLSGKNCGIGCILDPDMQ